MLKVKKEEIRVMKTIFKLLLITLIFLGIALSIINFISIDSMAMASKKGGTMQPDGCYGADLNC
jgi:hypothetical protein